MRWIVPTLALILVAATAPAQADDATAVHVGGHVAVDDATVRVIDARAAGLADCPDGDAPCWALRTTRADGTVVTQLWTDDTRDFDPPAVMPVVRGGRQVALVVARYDLAMLDPETGRLSPRTAPAFRGEGADAQSGMLTGVDSDGTHVWGYQVDEGAFLLDFSALTSPVERAPTQRFSGLGAEATVFVTAAGADARNAWLMTGTWDALEASRPFRGRPMAAATGTAGVEVIADGAYVAFAMAPAEADPELRAWRVWSVADDAWVELLRDVARGSLGEVVATVEAGR